MAIIKVNKKTATPERLAEIEAREAEWSATETERAWDNIRAKRDALIKTTDWAVLPDSPHNTQALLDYRQALRDLPQAYDKPEDVVWPDNPLEG